MHNVNKKNIKNFYCRFVIKSQMSAGEKFVKYNGNMFADLLL